MDCLISTDWTCQWIECWSWDSWLSPSLWLDFLESTCTAKSKYFDIVFLLLGERSCLRSYWDESQNYAIKGKARIVKNRILVVYSHKTTIFLTYIVLNDLNYDCITLRLVFISFIYCSRPKFFDFYKRFLFFLLEFFKKLSFHNNFLSFLGQLGHFLKSWSTNLHRNLMRCKLTLFW